MSELGRILPPEPEGPKGRDLYHKVRVPRHALGAPITVKIPAALRLDGDLVERGDPAGDGESVTLSVPADLPSTVQLRMRGLGEWCEDKRAGDLFLTVVPVDNGAEHDLTDAPKHALATFGRGGPQGGFRIPFEVWWMLAVGGSLAAAILFL